MRKLLFVLSDLEYGGVAAQASRLAAALPAAEFERRVAVLGRAGPWAETLRRAGVAVDVLGTGRAVDLRPPLRLRGVVRDFAPDALHAWGMPALRWLATAGFKGRLVASPCLRREARGGVMGRLDGWLLRKADQVAAFGETEAARCRALGVEAARLAVLNPAAPLGEPEADAAKPAAESWILVVGPLAMPKGIQDAIWSFDILRVAHPDLRLVIVGAGPERERLQPFVRGLEATEAVRFVGAVADVLPWMRQAEIVWSPTRADRGSQALLEAMAAGKPVVASRFPRVAELVAEEETGLLFPAEDIAALARQTQRLLLDEPLRRRLGEAARRRAESQFRPETLAAACAKLYKG